MSFLDPSPSLPPPHISVKSLLSYLNKRKNPETIQKAFTALKTLTDSSPFYKVLKNIYH